MGGICVAWWSRTTTETPESPMIPLFATLGSKCPRARALPKPQRFQHYPPARAKTRRSRALESPTIPTFAPFGRKYPRARAARARGGPSPSTPTRSHHDPVQCLRAPWTSGRSRGASAGTVGHPGATTGHPVRRAPRYLRRGPAGARGLRALRAPRRGRDAARGPGGVHPLQRPRRARADAPGARAQLGRSALAGRVGRCAVGVARCAAAGAGVDGRGLGAENSRRDAGCGPLGL